MEQMKSINRSQEAKIKKVKQKKINMIKREV